MNFRYLYILLLPLALSSCSIHDDENKETLLENKPSDAQMYEDSFSKMTLNCIKGDFKDVDTIENLYKKALIDNYNKKEASLLKIKTNKNFEKCAIKLRESREDKLFKLLVQNSRLAATIARSFYLQDDELNGAYWAQRVLNMEGLEYGYEVLGDVFIKDRKTLKIGANLLAEAVSRGNLNALTILQNASVQYSEKYFRSQKEAERKKNLQQERFDKFIEDRESKIDCTIEEEINQNAETIGQYTDDSIKNTGYQSISNKELNKEKNSKDKQLVPTNKEEAISFDFKPII